MGRSGENKIYNLWLNITIYFLLTIYYVQCTRLRKAKKKCNNHYTFFLLWRLPSVVIVPHVHVFHTISVLSLKQKYAICNLYSFHLFPLKWKNPGKSLLKLYTCNLLYYSKNILKYLKFQSIYLLITNKFPIDFSIKLIEGILFCMDLQ